MKEVNFITDFLKFWVLLQTVFGDVRLELGLKKKRVILYYSRCVGLQYDDIE